ncbi:hypothetical protein AHMF7605_22530 [Adhaeribacter arboris]|uniref:Uncharacterized protein n=1 Tax=Adhaeribacter arboris TaxID=2072846 RepID=A0A2T2YKP6_9BACT|nr:hypothetical protein [Adhaeribacter arboris]PSR56078.1 hypothetical protein AHMF7605_22530 [Adhaeribacter arboris]
MLNNSYFLFLFLIILLVSCTKEDNPPLRTQLNEVKIEIISGNNQSDTIGRVLPEPLVIKVTKADTVLKNVLVQFTDSSCVGLNWNSGTTNQLGLVKFHWQLNPTIGRQQLKISVQDPLQKVTKSVMALAEGTAPPKSWLPGNIYIPKKKQAYLFN